MLLLPVFAAQGLSEDYQTQLHRGVLKFVPGKLFQGVFEARGKIDRGRQVTTKHIRRNKQDMGWGLGASLHICFHWSSFDEAWVKRLYGLVAGRSPLALPGLMPAGMSSWYHRRY